MTVTEELRQPRRLLSKEIEAIRISGVKSEDIENLYSVLHYVHMRYGRETSFEIYINGARDSLPKGNVSGGGFKASDFWIDGESHEPFMKGFTTALMMFGFDVTEGPNA